MQRSAVLRRELNVMLMEGGTKNKDNMEEGGS